MLREIIQGISGYPGLFLFCTVSGILFPLPEDFCLIYAGVRIEDGTFSWLPVVLVTVLGVGIRDFAAFGIGRLLGNWLLTAKWVVRLFGAKKIERAQNLIMDHGPSAVLMGRFLVGFRAPLFMVAGAMGVRRRDFLFWDSVGLVVAVPLTVALGFAFGDPIAEGMFWLVQRFRIVVIASIVAFVGWFIWQAISEPPADAP